MLNVKTTKSLKAYTNKGVDSKSIRPIYDAVMRCGSIPIEHKLPFALQVANRFMNGGSPAGFQWRNGVFFYSVKEARTNFINNQETVVMCYSRVHSSTLIKWSDAINSI